MSITIRKTPCPDTTLQVNGIPEGTFAAGSTIDLQLTDGVNPVTPDSVTKVGNVVTVTVPIPESTCYSGLPLKTAQTTSYRSGDDGELQMGRDIDFLTLKTDIATLIGSTNPALIGNSNRFTDTLFGQDYANDVVVDWSTFEKDSGNLLFFKKTLLETNPLNTQITNIEALATGGFANWKMTNINQLFYLCKKGDLNATNQAMNYPPFNYGNVQIWTNTGTSATIALFIRTYAKELIIQGAETSLYSGQAVRLGNISELGL